MESSFVCHGIDRINFSSESSYSSLDLQVKSCIFLLSFYCRLLNEKDLLRRDLVSFGSLSLFGSDCAVEQYTTVDHSSAFHDIDVDG